MNGQLICRDAVEEDLQRVAYIRRSCGGVRVVPGSEPNVFIRFDAYMKACGYESVMDKPICGIDSILERRAREKANEKSGDSVKGKPAKEQSQ